MPHSFPERSPSVDRVAVERRVAELQKRSIKKDAKRAGIELAVSMIDLTTLAGADTPGKVDRLCTRAMRPLMDGPAGLTTGAVCVYPPFVAQAKKRLAGTSVKVAAVATYFPSGQASLATRLQEVRDAVESGADEIDMVIHRGRFLCGEHRFTYDEIAATKEACGEARLKVILETGELETYDNVRRASDIAIAAGADFIKTSTGKVSPAATMPVTRVMLEAIRDHYRATGEQIAMKPAGGIRNTKQALRYLVLVKETLGDAWLSPHWFRFGASSLLEDLALQYTKLTTGHYGSKKDVPIIGAY